MVKNDIESCSTIILKKHISMWCKHKKVISHSNGVETIAVQEVRVMGCMRPFGKLRAGDLKGCYSAARWQRLYTYRKHKAFFFGTFFCCCRDKRKWIIKCIKEIKIIREKTMITRPGERRK